MISMSIWRNVAISWKLSCTTQGVYPREQGKKRRISTKGLDLFIYNIQAWGIIW